MMVNIGFDLILYSQILAYFLQNFSFSESKKQIRYLIMNFLSFSVISIFHVILVKKQLIKHYNSSHCQTFKIIILKAQGVPQ